MKKLILALCILLAIACNADKKEQTAAQRDSTATAQTDSTSRTDPEMTLNGLTRAQADTMVREFLRNRRSSDTTTSIRFDTTFVNNILWAAKKHGIDGVRFYFAKKNGKNTLVPVATTKGPKSSRGNRDIHVDFFNLEFPSTITLASLANDDELEPPKGSNIYDLVGLCLHLGCPATESSVRCKIIRKWAKAFKSSVKDTSDIINVTSVWYNIKFFQRLAAKINAAKATKNPDGIRIYFVRNDQGKNGLIFYTTNREGNIHKDDHNCYISGPKFDIFSGDDRGEECPIFCPGTTWNDCQP